jgi:Ca2+-binding RTX toxin-like protein
VFRWLGTGWNIQPDGEAGGVFPFFGLEMGHAMGTTGNDTINGNSGANTLEGDWGNDVINALGGNDLVYGGTTNPVATIPGGLTDDDTIYGGNGADTVYGADGNDYVDGGAGVDRLVGNAGNDTLYGGAAVDNLFGGTGNDDLYGDAGNDAIYGEAGDDSIEGGDDNDLAYGGDNNDTIDGWTGNDTVYGGAGNDSLIGYEGNDSFFGDDGDDFINTRTSVGLGVPDIGYPGVFPSDPLPSNDRDTVDGGGGNDTIWTGDDDDYVTGGTGADSIDGGYDRDTIYGGDGSDSLIGGEGSDSIEGGADDDAIFGGEDPTAIDTSIITDDTDLATDNNRDTLLGGDGNDSIYGGDDRDLLFGEAGDDVLDGGIDNDTLSGGAGANTLTGGHGADTFLYTIGETLTITDFATGGQNTGDGLQDNNDFLDLSPYYSDVFEARADLADDGILNQSVGDFTDNTALAGSITLTGVTAATLSFDTTNLACFVRGTRIETEHGPRPVEEIEDGTLVRTLDNGLQPVRRVLSKRVAGVGPLAPVVFTKGALGAQRDLLVSPQHRMVLRGWQAELLIGCDETLAAAKHLVNGDTVYQRQMPQVEYFHLLFDRHEIVFAEGVATESYHPLLQDSNDRAPATQAELMDIYPELTAEMMVFGPAVRPSLKSYEARLFSV